MTTTMMADGIYETMADTTNGNDSQEQQENNNQHQQWQWHNKSQK